ncbi:hypothetical protein VTK73DRAFT_7984 [Phialemonium thermophilum]|uniref:Uncharacterized protein n=1 Tax=Phialemonium thermophilum TaxID=223376 RepID=A0ABR3WBW4_9PEZI
MASPSEEEALSRWQNTQMQGFHQIVALAQNYINEVFRFRWNLEAAIAEANHDKAKSLRRLYAESEALEATLEGQMLAPTVEFVLESDQNKDATPRIIFRLHFETGKLEYFASIKDARAGKKTTVLLDGWSVAYLVDIGAGSKIRQADAHNEIPSEVLNQINLPGNYNIARVLFLFSNAEVSTFRLASSKTPTLKPEDTDMFNTLMGKYLEDFRAKKYNTVGYAVTVPDAQEYKLKATCPPTAVRYQTMAHHPSGKPEPVATSGSSQFMFLEMTGDAEFPSDVLRWSGNWVASGKTGTMAICRASIWEGYLLPLISPVIKQSVLLVNDYVGWAFPDVVKSEGNTWFMSKDHKQPPDETFKWGKETDAHDGHTFSWTGKADMKSWGFISLDSQSYEGTVTVTAQWQPGTNRVKITTKQALEVVVRVSSYDPERSDAKLKYNVTVDWATYVSLASVKDGDIDVKIIQDQPTVTGKADYGTSLLSWLFSNSEREKETGNKIREAIEGKLKSLGLEHQLTAGINAQKHFIVPGAGSFSFDNPVFNKEGDLLIELHWH